MDIQKIISDLSHLNFGQCIDWIYMQDTKTVALKCSCGRYFCLANHTIHSDGSVVPSVVCPFNCGLHVFMRII